MLFIIALPVIVLREWLTGDPSEGLIVTTMLKAVGLFAAAILWAMLLTYAVRYKYLPDNWLGVGIVLGPSLVLLGIGAACFIKAMSRFQLGG